MSPRSPDGPWGPRDLHSQPSGSPPASPSSLTLVQPHQLHPTSASLKVEPSPRPAFPPLGAFKSPPQEGPPLHPWSLHLHPHRTCFVSPTADCHLFLLGLTNHRLLAHLSCPAPGGRGDQATYLAEMTCSRLSQSLAERRWSVQVCLTS